MKIVFVFVFVIILFGCNIFVPREAEAPRPPAEWHAFQTTPEMCLENLVFAYNFIENGWKYSSVLSSRFEFHFDPQDRIDLTLPISWGRIDEIDMLRNAHSRTGANGIELELTKILDQEDRIQANSAWIFRRYVLVVSTGEEGLFQTYTGKLELYLESELGLWVIREWSDFRDDNEWTWGRMKDAFSSI